MPPALNVRASGKNGARPPAEPLHPVIPNATENTGSGYEEPGGTKKKENLQLDVLRYMFRPTFGL